MKKLFAILLTIAMLLPLCTPIAATETQPPTIDEILNDYHEKLLFPEKYNTDADSAMYSSQKDSNSQTLEQQTVAKLTDAGYTAYNVTAENYNDLQNLLMTDFSEMGLNVAGSYIIVTGRNANASRFNPNSRWSQLPEPSLQDPDSGGPFLYTYEGNSYSMQYIYVTGSDLMLSKSVDLMETLGETLLNNILNSVVSAYLDSISGPLALGTVASLFGFDITSEYSCDNSSLVMVGSATWTRRYIQVWDEQFELWRNASYSEYARTRTTCTGHFYDETSASPGLYLWDDTSTSYSLLYNDTEELKRYAIVSYLSGRAWNDRTGDISLRFQREDNSETVVLTIRETI